ncbi:MAG: hypothetical protein ACTSUB_07580 [Candidatus Thorarchaeota archaeon]
MTEEDIESPGVDTWRKNAFLLTMIGCFQALILLPIAMIFYTGGTEQNPTTLGFSLLENFLSDLGRLIAFSGQPNIISSIIFNVSLFLSGLFLVLYFIAMPEFFKGLREYRWLCIAGSACGIFMAVTFIGGSLTPSDVFRPVHLLFGALSFTSALPVVILYTMALLGNEKIPKRFAVVFFTLGAVLVTYLLLLLSGGASGDVALYFTVGQKVVVFSIMSCFLVEAYWARILLDEK